MDSIAIETKSNHQNESNFIKKFNPNAQSLTLLVGEKLFIIEPSCYIKSPILLSYAQDSLVKKVIMLLFLLFIKVLGMQKDAS